MLNILKRLAQPAVWLFLIVTLCLSWPTLASTDEDFDENRVRLLSFVLKRQLQYHFSGKEMNDQLSRDAFHLYISQLDFQKRLLLKSEVDRLNAFREKIDDEFLSGRIQLAPAGAEALDVAIERASRIVQSIMSEPFDFSQQEDYETDSEKLEFCSDEKALRERWRQELKFLTLSRYLTLMEDEGFDAPAAVPVEKAVELEALAREKILKRHENYLTRLEQETLQDHYDRYLNSITRAFDPHTAYMAPQSKEDFDISMRGSLEGIGATLREEDGFVKVVKVLPGSAADRQGQLQGDDVVLAVAQGAEEPVDVTDMRLRDAVSLIRGKKGTEVRLTVKRPGHKSFVIPIIRDIVVIEESFVKSTVIEDTQSGQKYGYIKVPSFYRDFENTRNGGTGRNSTDDTRQALREFRSSQVNGLILDLRNNGGGALTDAVGVAGLFIEDGPIVQVRTGEGRTKILEDEDKGIEYNGPVVVLVNQFSASASEIVAGALQDYGRAVIVGSEHTHGKGTVQVVLGLDRTVMMRSMQKYLPLGALKLTTQKFYRVNGGSTQSRGVVPDVVLPDRRQSSEFGEKYLDYSLPWDEIQSVRHEQWPLTHAGLDSLQARSQERVSRSEDFAEIIRISKVVAERLENTRQSLNVETVYREWESLQDENSPHEAGMMGGSDGEEAESEQDQLSAEEKLRVRVLEDPYATEAMSILTDLLTPGEPFAFHPVPLTN